MSRRNRQPAFTSYYGRPILKEPTWEPLDIAGYLFTGGLAGGSSIIAAAASLSDRPALARACRLGASAAIGVSLAALVHDLGKPARFINMLRVAKPTSPMSVGSWLLAAYSPLVGAAAAADLTGKLPRVGRAAGLGAGVLGAGVASYTAALISDTAVPAWHDARQEMPYVFVGSAAAAAGGWAMMTAPVSQTGPARLAAAVGGAVEVTGTTLIERRIGLAGETYQQGKAGTLMRAAKALTGIGAIGGLLLGGRSRVAAALSGAALLGGSALTRFGIFEAGRASTVDPKYTVVPQRERLAERAAEPAVQSSRPS